MASEPEKSTFFSKILDGYDFVFSPIFSAYKKLVDVVTDWSMPYLHKVTDKFIADSIEKNAKDNPQKQELIISEVKRRGYGQGMSQDFVEPLIGSVALTVGGIAVKVGFDSLDASLKNKKFDFKGMGWIAMTAAFANQFLQVLRSIPRYVAGLQGAEKMALERYEERQIDKKDNLGFYFEADAKDNPAQAAFKEAAEKPLYDAGLATDQAVSKYMQKTPQKQITNISHTTPMERATAESTAEHGL